MSSPRYPKRAVRFFVILIFCFGLFSWASSVYFTDPSPSPVVTKEKYSPEYLESDLSQNSTWAKDAWIQQRQTDLLNTQQVLPEQSFIQQLQTYETQGHNLSALLHLPVASELSTKHSSITAILHATTKQSMKSQMDALTNQTMEIHTIWIICSSELYATAESLAAKGRSLDRMVIVMKTNDMNMTTSTHTYSHGSAGAAPWLSFLYQIQTDYIWILEDGVIPNAEYLKTMYGFYKRMNTRMHYLEHMPASYPPTSTTFTATRNLHFLNFIAYLLPSSFYRN
ncbi:unnamed protein product [Absidia cylindrospora]